MKTLTLALLLLAGRVTSAQTNPPVRMPADVAIFAVRHVGEALSIDPVVIVYYGRDQRFRTIPALNSPLPSQHGAEPNFDALETSLYKPGTFVSVFSGGEKLGTAAVRSSNIEGRGGGCVDLSASISYGGPRKPLLAANTTSEIPGHVSSRRNGTTAEVLLLRRLAIRWLADYGLDRSVLQRGRMGQVISTVLRRSAGRALVGRFDVLSKYATHRLFAIAEQDRGRYRLTLTNLEVQRDVQDGTDTTQREYIDQLDIDNDGLDEVVVLASHYESWSYAVWKFDALHGSWGHAYTGGGGGC